MCHLLPMFNSLRRRSAIEPFPFVALVDIHILQCTHKIRVDPTRIVDLVLMPPTMN